MNEDFIYRVRTDLCGCEWNNLGDRLKTCAGHATPEDFGAEPAPLQVAQRENDHTYRMEPIDRSANMLGNVLLALIGVALVALGWAAGHWGWL